MNNRKCSAMLIYIMRVLFCFSSYFLDICLVLYYVCVNVHECTHDCVGLLIHMAVHVTFCK